MKRQASGTTTPTSSGAIFTPIPQTFSSNTPSTKPSSFRPASARQHTNSLGAGTIYAVVLVLFWRYFILRLSLAHNPIRGMLETLPLLVGLQTAYCVLAKLAKPKKIKRSSDEYPSIGSQVSSVALATILSIALSGLVFVLLILFGAPLATLQLETFLCAVHISLLSVLPLLYVYNIDANVWRDIISVKLSLNSVYGAAIGTWLGAWLGAIPIPLDWDRPWQQWPITIFSGAYLGTAIGTVVGGIWASARKNIKHH